MDTSSGIIVLAVLILLLSVLTAFLWSAVIASYVKTRACSAWLRAAAGLAAGLTLLAAVWLSFAR